jgi:ankyrin repeat protein
MSSQGGDSSDAEGGALGLADNFYDDDAPSSAAQVPTVSPFLASASAVLGVEACKNPLFEATVLGNKAVVRALLKAGHSADGNPDADNNPPIYEAAKGGHLDVVNLLLAARAAIVVTDEQGDRESPLHAAAAGNHFQVVRSLVEAAQSRQQTEKLLGMLNAKRQLAEEVAEELHNYNIVKFLRVARTQAAAAAAAAVAASTTAAAALGGSATSAVVGAANASGAHANGNGKGASSRSGANPPPSAAAARKSAAPAATTAKLHAGSTAAGATGLKPAPRPRPPPPGSPPSQQNTPVASPTTAAAAAAAAAGGGGGGGGRKDALQALPRVVGAPIPSQAAQLASSDRRGGSSSRADADRNAEEEYGDEYTDNGSQTGSDDDEYDDEYEDEEGDTELDDDTDDTDGNSWTNVTSSSIKGKPYSRSTQIQFEDAGESQSSTGDGDSDEDGYDFHKRQVRATASRGCCGRDHCCACCALSTVEAFFQASCGYVLALAFGLVDVFVGAAVSQGIVSVVFVLLTQDGRLLAMLVPSPRRRGPFAATAPGWGLSIMIVCVRISCTYMHHSGMVRLYAIYTLAKASVFENNDFSKKDAFSQEAWAAGGSVIAVGSTSTSPASVPETATTSSPISPARARPAAGGASAPSSPTPASRRSSASVPAPKQERRTSFWSRLSSKTKQSEDEDDHRRFTNWVRACVRALAHSARTHVRVCLHVRGWRSVSFKSNRKRCQRTHHLVTTIAMVTMSVQPRHGTITAATTTTTTTTATTATTTTTTTTTTATITTTTWWHPQCLQVAEVRREQAKCQEQLRKQARADEECTADWEKKKVHLQEWCMKVRAGVDGYLLN